jgi:hypothetical protein
MKGEILMANEDSFDIRKYLSGIRAASGGRAESEGVSHQMQPERGTRPQAERERVPDYFERKQRERER